MSYYEIVVKGHIDSRRACLFHGLDMALRPDGATVLSGNVQDQAALHAVLNRIRDMGLPLLMVQLKDGPNGKAGHI